MAQFGYTIEGLKLDESDDQAIQAAIVARLLTILHQSLPFERIERGIANLPKPLPSKWQLVIRPVYLQGLDRGSVYALSSDDIRQALLVYQDKLMIDLSLVVVEIELTFVFDKLTVAVSQIMPLGHWSEASLLPLLINIRIESTAYRQRENILVGPATRVLTGIRIELVPID
ncbi:MAG: hypothetical protein CEO22_444 [Candidatus Berkelbacteria bacterium Gr01-1014_85]|uniref:Uncharacterized protein n=1 Tax=Candidatus Berkelbacteria bacterium Gr01-1014_85 TaxID=2017150 RepID=A0A554JB06_9BACT|nr:MAG: hypothetical protein CEO22_444 [Candidatus Berkelbacteria bacterium Gr01-1014_85]